MPLSFTAAPIGAFARGSRPADSEGAGVRAPPATASGARTPAPSESAGLDPLAKAPIGAAVKESGIAGPPPQGGAASGQPTHDSVASTATEVSGDRGAADARSAKTDEVLRAQNLPKRSPTGI